ncbi:biotin synthase auxiliary protein BsaP [Actinokineospora sp. NPDC004072]
MFCVHCGQPVAEGGHTGCHTPRTALEPPRYCAECARRMVVQVTPVGWTARCSRHGELSDLHPTA